MGQTSQSISLSTGGGPTGLGKPNSSTYAFTLRFIFSISWNVECQNAWKLKKVLMLAAVSAAIIVSNVTLPFYSSQQPIASANDAEHQTNLHNKQTRFPESTDILIVLTNFFPGMGKYEMY